MHGVESRPWRLAVAYPCGHGGEPDRQAVMPAHAGIQELYRPSHIALGMYLPGLRTPASAVSGQDAPGADRRVEPWRRLSTYATARCGLEPLVRMSRHSTWVFMP